MFVLICMWHKVSRPDQLIVVNRKLVCNADTKKYWSGKDRSLSLRWHNGWLIDVVINTKKKTLHVWFPTLSITDYEGTSQGQNTRSAAVVCSLCGHQHIRKDVGAAAAFYHTNGKFFSDNAFAVVKASVLKWWVMKGWSSYLFYRPVTKQVNVKDKPTASTSQISSWHRSIYCVTD